MLCIITAGTYKEDNNVRYFQRNKPLNVVGSRDKALMARRKIRAFSMPSQISFSFLHIFWTSEPILMLVPALESWGSALSLVAISTENGVKTKYLRSLEKSRNCGIFDLIFPELRVKTVIAAGTRPACPSHTEHLKMQCLREPELTHLGLTIAPLGLIMKRPAA